MKRFAPALVAITLVAGSVGVALGQSVVTDPTVIAACRCDGQSLTLLRGRVDEAQQVYERDRADLDTLDRQIAQAASSINVSVEGQVDGVRQLNVQREQLYARTYDVDLSALQQATRSYNDAAGQYSAQCAGKAFVQNGLGQEQIGQSCAPPAS